MIKLNHKVDAYLRQGCMRCDLGATPQCKVHCWQDELKELRRIVLDCGFKEEVKWGVPCYTLNGQNVVLVSALKDFAAISFFKGSLMPDPEEMLTSPGENSQATRYMKFTDVDSIIINEDTIKEYLLSAIEIEKSGKKVDFKKVEEFEIPEEFQSVLDENQDVREAFELLTPGRRRGYLLHFSAAKKSKTRTNRINKFIPKILEGKGFHDR
jgi:uncharacterized protein YdeI (YjbR/CyaY-like superfamily)